MLLFWAEQINLMLFYYVQNVYQKNQLGARLDKRIRSYNTGEEAGRSRYCFTYVMIKLLCCIHKPQLIIKMAFAHNCLTCKLLRRLWAYCRE